MNLVDFFPTELGLEFYYILMAGQINYQQQNLRCLEKETVELDIS